MYANTVYTGDPVYSRHFVASRINAPAAAVVAVVFTLDHIVTTQTTMGWTKSLQYRSYLVVVVVAILLLTFAADMIRVLSSVAVGADAGLSHFRRRSFASPMKNLALEHSDLRFESIRIDSFRKKIGLSIH